MSCRARLFLFALAGVLGCDGPRTTGTALINGRWLTGGRFEAKTMFVVGTALSAARPGRVDSTVDLAGGYVVPPYAEAHNHWLESKLVSVYNERYLLDGVFYVGDQGNTLLTRKSVDSIANRPTSIDFKSANQGWSGPGGHPIEIVQQMVSFGVLPAPQGPDGLDDDLFVVETEAEIEAKWPKFLAGRPDFVKVFLNFSNEYAKRRKDDRYGKDRGIDPALLPGIVRRAHAAGLQVHAHIANAADFHTAVVDSVDQIVHLPFAYDTLGPAVSRISDWDAAQAAAQHVVVVPTVAWVFVENSDSAKVARILHEVMVPNLQAMRRAGVTMLVGSDQFRHSSAIEAAALAKTGVFDNGTLLTMWSETTPRAIFPGRRIGQLDSGFEASFLVLDGDPLLDFSRTAAIKRRMKQGVWLAPKEERAVFPPLGN